MMRTGKGPRVAWVTVCLAGLAGSVLAACASIDDGAPTDPPGPSPSQPATPERYPLQRDDPSAQVPAKFTNITMMPLLDHATSPHGDGRVHSLEMVRYTPATGRTERLAAPSPDRVVARVHEGFRGTAPEVIPESPPRADGTGTTSEALSTDSGTQYYPLRAFVETSQFFPDNSGWGCSGTMVNPRTVLTSGHCVYNSDYGGWIASMRVMPGRAGGYLPYGAANMVHMYTTGCWIDSHTDDCDYAIVTLDRDIGSVVGWLGMADQNGDGWTIQMDGYPNGYGDMQMHSEGTLGAITGSMWFDSLESGQGFSGAGARGLGGQTTIVGSVNGYTNCTHFSPWPESYSGCGPRLTNDRIGALIDAMNADANWARDAINDDFQLATYIGLTTGETFVTGTTVNATHDRGWPCGCTGGGNVWYRFHLDQREVVYLDTAGSSYDTSLYVTDDAGTVVPGVCNNDAHCASGGFITGLESRVAKVLDAGYYRVSVGGCGSGNFVLHIQHAPLGSVISSYSYDTPIAGNGSTSTYLVGTSHSTSSCGGTASGEDLRWFLACGGESTFFSVCPGDGGGFTGLTSSGASYDPAIYAWNGTSGATGACNDDGGSAHACTGTGGYYNWGSRLTTTASRGINGIYVDERTAGSAMHYTLVYTVP